MPNNAECYDGKCVLIYVTLNCKSSNQTCRAVGSGEDFVSDFQFAAEERMLESTARAIASAVATASEVEGNQCLISLDVCGANSERCVNRNQKCGGSGLDVVLPCCDPDHRCFRRNSRDFRCRHRNTRIPSFWDGSIADCTL